MVNHPGEAPVVELIGAIIDDRRKDILGRYDELLIRGDPNVSRASQRYLRRQADAVLDDVRRQILAPGRPANRATPVRGSTRPPEYPPLRQSLRAGSALSEAVLTTVVAGLPERPDLADGLVQVAQAVQRAVTRRLAIGAIAYLGHLLEQLHRSHADERRQVARDLHDLVAHSVAVGLQNLELYAMHRGGRPEHAEHRLELALATLREALDTIRALAQDLRRSGAEEGLESALRATIGAALAVGTGITLQFQGDEEHVPQPIRGELFLILREGLRNALAHASASRVAIDVDIRPGSVRAGVVDDGRGFDPHRARGGTGLASMRERATLLGGVLDVRSGPDRGTTVQVEIPLRGYGDDAT